MEERYTLNESHDWANEYIVLFEAPNEHIILHRNMIRNEEFVVMTTNLIDQHDVDQKLWCTMVDYHHLLKHRLKIKRYQKSKDNYALFKVFFKMSINEFFGTISEPIN